MLQVGCSLVGGETAEMPGVYLPKQWDLAGCAIALRQPSWPFLPKKNKMQPGDVLIGLRSSGVHSNGFSLVRKIMALNKASYKDTTPWDQSKTFGNSSPISLISPRFGPAGPHSSLCPVGVPPAERGPSSWMCPYHWRRDQRKRYKSSRL